MSGFGILIAYCVATFKEFFFFFNPDVSYSLPIEKSWLTDGPSVGFRMIYAVAVLAYVMTRACSSIWDAVIPPKIDIKLQFCTSVCGTFKNRN